MTTKERPILFSAPMVRAILAGRKTMTRRIFNGTTEHNEPYNPAYMEMHKRSKGWTAICPYGTPGDRLWVRETWTPDHRDFYPHFPAVYKADAAYDYERNEKGEVYSPEQKSWYPYRWRPSIHMPRWASRITLQVEAVRVERLQDITGADAKAEGCDPDWEAFEDATRDTEGWDEPEEFDEECEVECDWVNYGRRLVETHEHREWEIDRTTYALRLAFRNLWESINGEGSWDANPFVWCLTFSRVNG